MPSPPRVTLVVRPQDGARRPVTSRYDIFIDGKPLGGVRAIDISMSIHQIPLARITLIPDVVEIDVDPRLVMGRAEFSRQELLAGVVDTNRIGHTGPHVAKIPNSIERRFFPVVYRFCAGAVRVIRMLGMFKPPVSEDQARLQVQRRVAEIAAADGTVKSAQQLLEIQEEVLRAWLNDELHDLSACAPEEL